MMLIEKELYDKVSELTNTDYLEIIYNPGARYAFISEYAAYSMITDLLHEIDVLQEKVDDLEQDIEYNYKPIKQADQYEISNHDFI